jgi:hypothetical protein
MRSAKLKIMAAVTAAGLLCGAQGASAWVAVRAVRPVGAAAVGVAAGAVAGAAVASTYRPYYGYGYSYPYPSSSSTTVNNTTVVQPAQQSSVITSLPGGCTESGGVYTCGSVRYKAFFGDNGVYYQQIQ